MRKQDKIARDVLKAKLSALEPLSARARNDLISQGYVSTWDLPAEWAECYHRSSNRKILKSNRDKRGIG